MDVTETSETRQQADVVRFCDANAQTELEVA